MPAEGMLTIGDVPLRDYPLARRLVASAFAQEPFARGMFGDSAVARFIGMAHEYEEWPSASNPVVIGATAGGHLLGVAVATLPGECGLCDTPSLSLDGRGGEGHRIEYEYQLACQRAHVVNEIAPHARIGPVATEPSLHGNGIGRVLMAAVIDQLRQRRVECVVLECLTTRAGFYEHLGFRSIDEFDDPGGPGLRSVLMQLDI